jgi:hypothetical protein
MRFAFLGCAVAILAGCEGLPLATTLGVSGATGSTRASSLVFTVEPAGAVAGGTMAAVELAAENSSGTVDTSFTGTVNIAIGTNPVAGSLGGVTTITATAGLAVFNNLTITPAGNGYTLVATASGLAGATSSAFNVVP